MPIKKLYTKQPLRCLPITAIFTLWFVTFVAKQKIDMNKNKVTHSNYAKLHTVKTAC